MANYAIGNRVDETYMLMVMVPILIDHTASGPSYSMRVRQFLQTLPAGKESPFHEVPSLHFCRFVLLDDVPAAAHPVREDHLQSPYILMSASIAGDWEVCIKSMVAAIPHVIRGVFENCVAFPGTVDGNGFVEYLRKCQIDAAFSFGAYPQASLYEVRRAVDIQAKFREFVIEAQAVPRAELQGKFREFLQDLEAK